MANFTRHFHVKKCCFQDIGTVCTLYNNIYLIVENIGILRKQMGDQTTVAAADSIGKLNRKFPSIFCETPRRVINKLN